MTTKFTSGPWFTERMAGHAFIIETRHGVIGEIYGTNEKFPELGDGESDASLVAAAPEMYAALERLARVASVELAGKRDDVLEQAQSALAKARGES